jgi:hypothetical protein
MSARNNFARHGINHLSPSALNLWVTAPGIWAWRYIGKAKEEANAAMWRGSAVEAGMAALLRGQSGEASVAVALQSFDLNAAGAFGGDEVDAERDLIAPMIEQCARWAAPSMLNATQIKVEYFFDPIPIPVIGYTDFCFDGIDVDLKSTKACPSTPRPDHIRQVALYRAARVRSGGILYVTNKKIAYYEVTDEAMDVALQELHAAALSLNSFLSRCHTRQDVLSSLPVDWGHFQAPKTRVPLADILSAG